MQNYLRLLLIVITFKNNSPVESKTLFLQSKISKSKMPNPVLEKHLLYVFLFMCKQRLMSVCSVIGEMCIGDYVYGDMSIR